MELHRRNMGLTGLFHVVRTGLEYRPLLTNLPSCPRGDVRCLFDPMQADVAQPLRILLLFNHNNCHTVRLQ
jgi:hypothetical protein